MLKIEKNNNDVNHLQPMSINEKDSPSIGHSDPGPKKGVRSERQLEASRRNGRRSRGPRDTERTRYNAMRHGLRAQGLTPWDDPDEYIEIVRALEDKYDSSNPFDAISISESALEIVRMHRMNRLEADNIIALSSFSEPSGEGTSKGTPTIHFATLKEYGGLVLDLVNRYKTAGMNRLLRYRRELERIPRDEASPRDHET